MAHRSRTFQFQARGLASPPKADAVSQIPSTTMDLEVAVGMGMAHTSQNTETVKDHRRSVDLIATCKNWCRFMCVPIG